MTSAWAIWYWEETLNLTGVQIEREKAIGSGSFDQIRQQTRRDRHARLIFLVAAAIGKIRHHRRDAASVGTLHRIQQDQQFHDVMTDRRDQRLNDKHILAAHTRQQPHKNVVIGKANNLARAERHAQALADFLG